MRRPIGDPSASPKTTTSYRCAWCDFEEEIAQNALAYLDALAPGLPGRPEAEMSNWTGEGWPVGWEGMVGAE